MNTYGGKDATERSRASANSDLHKTTAQRATAGGRAGNGLAGIGQIEQRLNSTPRIAQLARISETLAGTMDSHAAVAQARAAGSLQAGQVSQRRTIDDELQALEDEYQQTDDPLLRRVLEEARLLSDVEFTSVHDPEQGHAERETQGDTRAHLINLDPRITDPETRQSLILHELIHVSADRKYNVNQTGEPEPAITAVVNPLASEPERLEDIRQQNVYRRNLATHLASVVEGDWVVDEEASKLVLARVPRIQGASHREFDSVVTELYYRLKKMGVDERSDTFREVKAMTEAAYRSRNEGLRLDQTYREPMKTGFFA
jgi:hypothetical protein